MHEARYYIWDDQLLVKRGNDQIIRRCIPEEEMMELLDKRHLAQYGGHFAGERTARKVLVFIGQTLFKDCHELAKKCQIKSN